MFSIVLFIFALNILFVPFALSDGPPCVTCVYAGQVWAPTYKYSLDVVPERCDVIIYSSYLFGTPVDDADKSAIKSLVAAGKIVYAGVGFQGEAKWTDVFADADNKMVGPLETYINDLGITGIILDTLRIYDTTVTDYAQQINTFVCKLKAAKPSLKVGMFVDGVQADSFVKKELFDFTVTNDNMDLYIIDATGTGVPCDAESAKTGRYPVTSLDAVCQGVATSAMDQSKVLIGLYIAVNQAASYETLSYGDYCAVPRADPNAVLCADSSQLFYSEVEYVKKYFKGIVLIYVSNDDFGGTCGCGINPVANTYIDAWQSKAITCCAKISGA